VHGLMPDQLPSEHGIVSARMSGDLSADVSFERLYAVYAPVVIGWLALRVEPNMVDDLFQDVWTVFYGRWRTWQRPPEMDIPEARPVLSFLFRTVHLVSKAHHRVRRVHESIDDQDIIDENTAPQRLIETITFGQCLELARMYCSEEDLAIFTGKLAGLSAREIACTLELSEPTVDHRYRNALAHLREQLTTNSGGIG
jgi:DNA-directed RNA polymerase specialized sigma24 family protein